jgi:GNAT superfamily N-acetyltransferase
MLSFPTDPYSISGLWFLLTSHEFVTHSRYEGANGEGSAEIAIVVVPEWRRLGVGRVLVEALEEPALRSDITLL